MTEAHWLFLVPSGLVIAVAGALAVIREVKEQGVVWNRWVLRLFFLFVTAGVGYAIPTFAPALSRPPLNLDPRLSMIGAIILFLLVSSAEVFIGALNISTIVFGAMIGIVVAHLAYFLLLLVIEPMMAGGMDQAVVGQYTLTVKVLLSVVFAYLFVLLIHKNRDRFNFIIPYVEFRRERRGGFALLVDTSAVIDGRLAGLCEARVIDGTLIVPKFVLQELQALADSSDKLKRVRGRRGMDMLNRLRKNRDTIVQIDEGRVPGVQDVDAKLIKLAETLGARIVTTDINLNKAANVQGVDVLNLNDIASAMRPQVLPGEVMMVDLIRAGESPGQAVGYMDDGTMIVVEDAKSSIGSEIEVVVTRLLQTSTGRIIFAKVRSNEPLKSDKNGQDNR